MPDAFLLAEIQELGRRDADAPAADAIEWSGMRVGDDDLRAIHAALHPSLALAAVAGYQPDGVLLLPPRGGDVLNVAFSPRAAGVDPAAAHDVAELVDATSLVAVVRLPTRAGLRSTAVVPPAAHVVDAPSGRYLVLDLGAAAAPVGVVSAIVDAQQDAVTALAHAIATAHRDAGPTLTGLVSVLDPALWDFRDDLVKGSGATTEALRDLGRPIAAAALRDRDSLETFLVEEATGRLLDGADLPSVQRRLTGDVATEVPVNPPFVEDEARGLERAWQREAEALFNDLHPLVALRPPFRVHDHRRLTYLELVLDAVNQGLFGTVAFDLDAQVLPYGGYDLRYTRAAPGVSGDPTDHDPDPNERAEQTYIYAGQTLTGRFASKETTPAYVKKLRDDLAKVGFGPLADADLPKRDASDQESEAEADARRRFGPWLEAALREFQVYASMARVARRPLPNEPQPGAGGRSLGSTLIPLDNDRVYKGPRSGVLNAATRELLKMWVERDWHCPVVVEARQLTRGRLAALRSAGPGQDRRAIVLRGDVTAANQNVWLARQVTDESLAFIVWDHTGVATAEPYRAGQPMVLCRYILPPEYPGWGGAVGMGSDALGWSAFLHPSGEVSPSNIFGQPPANDEDPALWSTFRVIRAVCEVECLGYFDGLNGWDWALTSGGPLHWTLGLLKNGAGERTGNFSEPAVLYPGELGAFLEYFAAVEPAEYHELFGRYGIGPASGWQGAGPPHFLPAHRKYSGFVAVQADDGSWVDLRRAQVPGQDPVVSEQDSQFGETFKTWHWTHRILYASRTSRVMTGRMWEFTRARVRELLSTPWRVDGVVTKMTELDADGNAFFRECTLGDIFTSERTVAALVRQHVYNPPHLFGVSDRLAQWRNATITDINFKKVKSLFTVARDVNKQEDPGLWGDAEQEALANAMDGEPNPEPLSADGLKKVADWPDWVPNIWGYDTSWLPLASASPVIGPLPNITVVRGSSAVVSVNARTASAFPVSSIELTVAGDPAGLLVSAPVAGFDFFIEADVTADLGRWTATVTASDGLHVTTLRFDIDVSDNDDPPSDAVCTPAVANPTLDMRHRSFLLDADEFDPFPAP